MIFPELHNLTGRNLFHNSPIFYNNQSVFPDLLQLPFLTCPFEMVILCVNRTGCAPYFLSRFRFDNWERGERVTIVIMIFIIICVHREIYAIFNSLVTPQALTSTGEVSCERITNYIPWLGNAAPSHFSRSPWIIILLTSSSKLWRDPLPKETTIELTWRRWGAATCWINERVHQ